NTTGTTLDTSRIRNDLEINSGGEIKQTGSASIFYAIHNGITITKDNAPRFVTGNLNVTYLKPTPLGKELEITGKLKEVSRKKIITSIEINVDGVCTVKGEVTAILLPENFGKAK
ncbi:MAG: hypothetical protein DSY82_06245, partial [Flavobacteriia bacterium]